MKLPTADIAARRAGVRGAPGRSIERDGHFKAEKAHSEHSGSGCRKANLKNFRQPP
jgi:hypothetical protein